MSESRHELYKTLYDIYFQIALILNKTKQSALIEANKVWNELKATGGKDNEGFIALAKNKTDKLKQLLADIKADKKSQFFVPTGAKRKLSELFEDHPEILNLKQKTKKSRLQDESELLEVTMPAELCEVQLELERHVDTEFCKAIIHDLENIASILGPHEVFYLSRNHKSRICLGTHSDKKDSPILMRLEYRATLPDHDWVLAEPHKLMPSIYAAMVIEPGGFAHDDPDSITHVGPTYVAIRSGKHCLTSADTHSTDLCRVLELPEFDSLAKTPEG